jgi:hypothetical protein
LLNKWLKQTNKVLIRYDWLYLVREYAAYHGGTKEKALAGNNATMSRVNGIFNKDLAVQLLLIANNDVVVYPRN